MLTEVVSGLLHGNPYEMEVGERLVKVELRRRPYNITELSLLTSENGNPVGYLDFSHSRKPGDHSQVTTNSGGLGYNGYVLDNRFSYYPDFEDKGGFEGYHQSWGFFIREEYQRQGIGPMMFGITLGISRELQEGHLQPRHAFFMVYKMMSNFYGRYFRNGSQSLPQGVDYYEEYSGNKSALVFPDFEIPEPEVKQARKLEIPKHTYWY